MTRIDWRLEVEKRKDALLAVTQEFLQINSVYDETTITKKQPFGKGIDQALAYLLDKAESYAFSVKNIDGYAGKIELGEGEESVGNLCHIDVVPAGEGWTSPPFSAESRDGRIYARGAIDNKGPTIAAFFALCLVKELELPLEKRVQLILGTDEERDWRCVEHYFKHEEMPTVGFAPDADFPIIHAEKGIVDVLFEWPAEKGAASGLELSSFTAGERLNMVPDRASAEILGERAELDGLERLFRKHLLEQQHNGEAVFAENGRLILIYEGVAAHGSTPEAGINAGVELAAFLAPFSFQEQAVSYLQMITSLFHNDMRGEALGIAMEDQVSGPLTVNSSLFTWNEKEAGFGLNIRYPVTVDGQICLQRLEQKMSEYGAKMVVKDHMTPSYVDAQHPLVRTLQAVYQRQMGEEPTLLSTGGGTYARTLATGVAFGPLFPGRKDVAHQKDEYIEIEDLLKATALYAEAIYELAGGCRKE
ncbi:dipeptidase PepV [Halalkalibacter oceani]|uniref:dipeptidase PepV n=1 Tax=Halalkalibacter oceani TaxID=1653776 RepID=UPI0033919796